MLCMHPRFMEKYATVVAQKALDDEVFEQKEGIPILADFEEMRALLRRTQKVWKADPVMQGKVPQWVPKSSGNAGGGAGNGNGGNNTSTTASTTRCNERSFNKLASRMRDCSE